MELVKHKSTTDLMRDSGAIDQFKETAKLMAQSQISIPDHFRGKPADCLAVIMQAAQWGMNPFVVAQKTFVINGTLGYEAQLLNAVVSSSKVIDGRFKFEHEGDRKAWVPTWVKSNRNGKDFWTPKFSEDARVRCGARVAGEEEITWTQWIYPADQTVFNSPLWRSNPQQQANYLAVKFWVRLYAPDVLMGVYTPEELQEAELEKDITPKTETPKPKSALSKLMQASNKKADEVVEDEEKVADIDADEQNEHDPVDEKPDYLEVPKNAGS